MNSKDKKKIQEVVQKEISKTISSISEYKTLTQPISPENAIGRVSRMDAINNKSVIEVALRQAEKKLENLKIVDKEIGKKKFGICLRCSQKIPLARLLIIPETRKCVSCA